MSIIGFKKKVKTVKFIYLYKISVPQRTFYNWTFT